MKTIAYDTSRFPFAEIVAAHLNVRDLARLHEIADYPTFTRATDQRTAFHRRFYQIGETFFEVYHRFLRDVAAHAFGGAGLIHQRIPTFRVHLPNNLGVGEFHRDSDYAHPRTERNFWLPLTDAWGTNTIWIESEPGAGDYAPRAVRYGEVLLFDGGSLKHGNRINDTCHTRVSFDFRVIPKSDYAPSDGASINTNMRFEVGGYYEDLADYSGGAPNSTPNDTPSIARSTNGTPP